MTEHPTPTRMDPDQAIARARAVLAGVDLLPAYQLDALARQIAYELRDAWMDGHNARAATDTTGARP